MFGQMVRIKSVLLVGLGEFQPILKLLDKRYSALIHMFKDAEFHLFLPWRYLNCSARSGAAWSWFCWSVSTVIWKDL